MLSLKYIRIRKERPAEQCLSTVWRDACTEFDIPCVLVYLEEDNAYISARLQHLQDFSLIEQNAAAIEAALIQKQLTYAGSAKGFWKHHNGYYTFDSIPRAVSREAAEAIFKVVAGYLKQNPPPEPAILSITVTPAQEETILEPETEITETSSLNPLQEP